MEDTYMQENIGKKVMFKAHLITADSWCLFLVQNAACNDKASTNNITAIKVQA